MKCGWYISSYILPHAQNKLIHTHTGSHVPRAHQTLISLLECNPKIQFKLLSSVTKDDEKQQENIHNWELKNAGTK